MKKIGNVICGLLENTFYCIFGFVFSLCLSFSPHTFAKTEVQASVPQNIISLEDNLVMTISISSDESIEADEPKIPPIDGFRLINSWTSSSTSSKLMQTQSGMQFQTIRRQEFNYQLSPDRLGKFQIPAFEVLIDGKPYHTKAFSVSVEKNEAGGGQQGQQGQRRRGGTPNFRQQLPQMPGLPDMNDISDADEMFNQLLQRRMGRSPQPAPPANQPNKHNPNESFFVQLELDKTNVYEGEQITATWYLYNQGNIISLDRAKMPELKGFWKEVIEEVPALNFEQIVVNGISYRRAMLATHALFPIKPGYAVVDEYKIKASIQSAQGPFGFGPAYTYTRSSERVKVDVKPLPLEGKPKDFNGAVGQFEMQAFIEDQKNSQNENNPGKNSAEQTFPANQPFTLKVRFDGTGNAKTLDMPTLQLPPGLELYDTKSESKFFKNGRSYKEFNVLIIPRSTGEIEIPALTVSMFDPASKKYYSKKTEPIKVKIIPGAAVPQANTSITNLSGQALVNTEKKNELPNVILSPDVGMVSDQYKIFLQISLWLICVMIILIRAKKELFSLNSGKNIDLELRKRVKKINLLIDKDDWRAVGTETSNLIYLVMGIISGQAGANQLFEKLLDMAPSSVRREVGVELSKQMQFFQTVGFAPAELVGSYKEKKVLRRELEAVMKTLSKAIELSNH